MKLDPYLNFDGTAEEAFYFYRSVFGGELTILKVGEVPEIEAPEEEKELVMHVSLPIGESNVLMGSDISPSQGHALTQGNGNYISLTLDSREEADRVFNELSAGGNVEMPMAEMFWGDYFGSFQDKYGVYWMISFPVQQ